jgi:two-component system, OmpR family, response regulator
MQTKKKILLVEDDVNFGAVMRDYLAMNGYNVVLSPDGNKGWNRFSNEPFDLCILDVMMPDRDGFSLGKDIRKVNARIPLIFLTAKALKEDIIKGFGLGADDYITKPFDPEILLYKLKALLNRIDGSNGTKAADEFEIGKYHFNHKLRELTFGDTKQKLSPREADLLKLLCIHINDVLPREVALKSIWGDENYFTGRSMDVFVTRIRKFFKDDSSVEIVNVHGNGFRMIAEKK